MTDALFEILSGQNVEIIELLRVLVQQQDVIIKEVTTEPEDSGQLAECLQHLTTDVADIKRVQLQILKHLMHKETPKE